MATTSARTLRLLSLLQTHRFWPGPELAERLEVSERTLRRDVERLRELGYPVDAARGSAGGYQLGAGAAMPPLTVEEDEAIAMAVALNGAAQLTSGPLAEASVSALSKVVQVLPPRLRRRAEALRAVTDDSPFARAPEVRADVLATVAQATRDEERLRFRYTAAAGSAPGEDRGRHVEPHRLVTVGRRWYLVAYDLERQDWRSFRLDRLREPAGTRARFRPRSVPGGDPAAFVRQGLSRWEREDERMVAVVDAPAADVEKRLGRWASVVAVDETRCRIEMAARDPAWLVFSLGTCGATFRLESATDGVRAAVADWAARLASA
ncbi:helix-turn-helix transcriptional regulator [Lapillicoccus jejuensis]|uniref:HTH domain-containing protein n=1 Tax=Lapillicoccus jejuensis TaxID=402171 RepID=A0A542E0Q0_9MICO|nr:transcriptional regulator [Lapillicoccus jejuensis]TQJ08917.1 HTH domain-containing protein [Lapillicoccus jejuensis]